MSRKPAPPAAAPSNLAVVYTRVSSAEQVDGTSLDTQREICGKCADRLGLSVISTLCDEARSAKTTAGRLALAEALALCESKGAALIVYKFDRLARNVGDAYQMRDLLLAKGCRIISATEGEATASPIAKAMFSMMATFAELDNDMRAERSRLGMRARAQAGGWVSLAPFGFKLCRAPGGIPSLEPGDGAEVIRAVFAGVADGTLPVPDAVEVLRRNGHSRAGSYLILRNPVYCGIIRNSLTDGQPVQAVFPGLVTREVWDAVQLRIDASLKAPKNIRKTYAMQNADFPFTRLIPCPVCGKTLRGGWSRGRGRARYGYYFCSTKGHCSIPRDEVHARFRELAASLAGFRDFMALVRDQARALDLGNDAVETASLRRAEAEEARQTHRLSNLRDALLDGTFGPEEYAAQRREIDVALADARAVIETHRTMVAHRETALDALCGVVASAGDVFDRLTPAQTKEFVRLVFGEVTLSASKTIEPAQGSVYQILASAQGTGVQNGGGEWI